MRLGVIADVHANLAALEAVLEDCQSQAVDRLVCLGDLVGYHAEPGACVERVLAAAHVIVAGNHDVECARGLSLAGTHSVARQVQDWTREQLGGRSLAALAGLPNLVREPGLVAAHGCFLNDVHYTGYVTSTMLPYNLQAVAAREDWGPLALCGHTHVPLLGWLDAEGCQEPRFEGEVRWPATAQAVLLNPGSVGQPRDGDTRAAYAVVDLAERRARLRRVPYDIERTLSALRAAGLPESLGERLKEGR